MSDPALFHLGHCETAPAEPLLYPPRHLVTHAVILGMTGSGKTGLGCVLLEEAALAGLPVIAVDPKGDLGNLLLAFPEQRPEDYAPFVPEGEDPAAVAQRAREGLAASGQSTQKLARFAAIERTIHTPGSRLGRPLSLMPSLEPPVAGTDDEGARARAVAAASALLSLAGIEADPVRSPEHSLIAHVLLHHWRGGGALDVTSLLRAIQSPPFERLGVMDLESVVPARARQELAVRINAALASPALSAMIESEPLEVGAMLRPGPRISILSIGHLGDAERTFFLTALLGEVIAWMRAQEGTSSLRAILYVDEIAGYFPPVAAPPTKGPMLTLLKQARAFGLGVVLATQNPVDLDYKGLSNCGTWMLGRLQTGRDKLRVLDGLESLEGGLDRAQIDAMLSRLAPRTFLLHDVHRGPPELFRTRWALSYLRGPLSREHLVRLRGPAPAPATATAKQTADARPLLPPEIPESFVIRSDVAPRAYRPGLAIRASIAYADAKLGVDTWSEPAILVPLDDEGPRWADAWWLAQPLPEADQPLSGVPFAPLPSIATRPANYPRWARDLVAHVVQHRPLTLAHAPDLGVVATPGETREAFWQRVVGEARRARDEALRALESKWASRIEKARERVATAERRVSDASFLGNVDLVEASADVIGALVGGRRSLRRASTSALRRTARAGEKKDRAREQLAAAKSTLEHLEREHATARDEIERRFDPARIRVEEKRIAAKRTGVRVERIALVWVPSPA